jgi:diphosphate-dependent phosphofructokinase
MKDQEAIKQEEILNSPIVRETVLNTSAEVIRRRSFFPGRCVVFESSYTFLEETDRFEFKIHPESAKQLPDIINNKVQTVKGTDSPDSKTGTEYCKKRNIGVVFSGGPAPGGHNVIAGLFDAAKKANPDSKIFGFLLGPDGIIENEAIEVSREHVDHYRNLGGFGMIKTGRTKIDNDEKMKMSAQTLKELQLDALVVVGGDDSNTNAAFLAQEMFSQGIQVIGVPKTIDGDIQVRDSRENILCAMSFGFHSAAHAFANAISNLATDCCSDVKYWHVCKVMGRVASHLALEVALKCHPNITLIGEDIADYIDQERIERAKKNNTVDYTAYGMTLRNLSRVICDGIVRRAAVGKNYGVLVIPEGVLEFINEIQMFIIKLNTIIADYNQTHDNIFHMDFPHLEDKLDYLRRQARLSREYPNISIWNTRDDDLFNDIPDFFQEGLLTERDAHGNFQFSQVQTEKVILDLVKDYLGILKDEGKYKMGIAKKWYEKTMIKGGLDPQKYGPVIFKNYGISNFLLIKPEIISKKTLRQVLENGRMLKRREDIPKPLKKIFEKSVPKFKTQTHFYGYDGRGSDPTWFDCTYTYNLGLTVFSLIANGATGQMAAIRNLELGFDHWEPLGIPIAPMMHLEERKGRLELVLEKSIVDVNSVAFRVVKALREQWLSTVTEDECYRNPGPNVLMGDTVEDRPLTLKLNSMNNIDHNAIDSSDYLISRKVSQDDSQPPSLDPLPSHVV